MEILANSAKYDVSCSSSGVETNYKKGELGATHTNWNLPYIYTRWKMRISFKGIINKYLYL